MFVGISQKIIDYSPSVTEVLSQESVANQTVMQGFWTHTESDKDKCLVKLKTPLLNPSKSSHLVSMS